MNHSSIKFPDIANGTGCRVSLFVSGCDLRCPGCFNSDAWDFSAGEPFDGDAEAHVLGLLAEPFAQGLTLLGGEPLHPRNAPGVLRVCQAAKAAFPEKDIWVYTGRTLEGLVAEGDPSILGVLGIADVLVDGPYVEAQRDVTLRFRGSRNQRVIDLAATRSESSWDDPILLDV